MIEPTKHEDLKQNLLVIGGEIIRVIKHQSMNIEDAYQQVKKTLSECSLDHFYDSVTFLWMLNFIQINQGILQLNKKENVSQETLF